MPECRLYELTRDNHITDVPETITFESDEAAILKAQEMVDGHDIELCSSLSIEISQGVRGPQQRPPNHIIRRSACPAGPAGT